ncbi:hypothetical protein B0H13DRAFT_2391409 [Mycena leptocephala]|nr:hypothetical protein B0H13DRAFT_2391409 [Mycena leptocephala]
MPGEEELAGLAFLVRDRLATEDARAFGQLWGACHPRLYACDAGVVGTFSMACIQMALHAASSSLTPPRSSLCSFLFWTVLYILSSRFSAESSLQPTLYVLLLHPPTIYPLKNLYEV